MLSLQFLFPHRLSRANHKYFIILIVSPVNIFCASLGSYCLLVFPTLFVLERKRTLRHSSSIFSDANGQLPIHIAATKGLRCNVELLLRDDPDFVNKINNFDQSLILLAAKNGFSDVVSYLLSKNADYALKDKSGLTAFDWAVKRILPNVVKVFLEKSIWKEVIRIKCNIYEVGLCHNICSCHIIYKQDLRVNVRKNQTNFKNCGKIQNFEFFQIFILNRQ